jgi:hypothetical protein
MHLNGYQDVFFISTYGLAIVMLSSLAAWKNRNPLGWGLIGGLFFPTSFLCLLLESHLCPKCKCPTCGTLARRTKPDRSLIPAHEGTV